MKLVTSTTIIALLTGLASAIPAEAAVAKSQSGEVGNSQRLSCFFPHTNYILAMP